MSQIATSTPAPIRRAIGDSANLPPERTFWHMLFPLGGRESRWDVVYLPDDDGFATLDMAEAEFEFTTEWLNALIEAHRAYQQISGRHGNPPIPLPVSMQHLIEERMSGCLYEQPALDDLARAGGLHDLHLCDDPALGYPLGLYGLIAWTPSALRKIDDGEWECLSPTTWWDWQMTEPGVYLEGESIQAVGLVDRGALDSIGTTRDRLPMDAFARAPIMRRIQRASVWGRRPTIPDSTARAQRAMIPAPSDQEPPMDGDKTYMTAEDAQAMITDALAPIIERLDGVCKRLDGEGEDASPIEVEIEAEAGSDDDMEERAVEPVAEPVATSEPEPVAPAGPVEDAIARSAAAIRAQGVAAIADEASTLVKARRLLPANVEAYIRRSLDGADVSDIVGDYSGAATMTGSPTTSDSAPAAAPAVGPLKESEALARAKAEMPTAGTQAQIRRCYEIMDEARAAGRTVLAHQ